MKKKCVPIITLISLLHWFSILSQPFNMNIITNYRLSSWYFVTTDTSQNNIWQIGHQYKPAFIHPDQYFYPLAIMTDTLNSYPINNTSSFFINIELFEPSLIWTEISFHFSHSFEMDTLSDYGLIEISYDQGDTWYNIFEELELDESSDLQPTYSKNNNLIFTGNSNGYGNTILNASYECDSGFRFPEIIVKTTFKSDSIDTKKAGWSFSLLSFDITAFSNCATGNINNTATMLANKNPIIYPSPLKEQSHIIFQNPTSISQLFTLKIFNMNGQAILRQNNITLPYQLYRDDFNAGMHFLQLQQKNEVIYKVKFLVE